MTTKKPTTKTETAAAKIKKAASLITEKPTSNPAMPPNKFDESPYFSNFTFTESSEIGGIIPPITTNSPICDLADVFAATGIFKDMTPAQIAFQILAGAELGFKPVQSMYNLKLEDSGKFTLSDDFLKLSDYVRQYGNEPIKLIIPGHLSAEEKADGESHQPAPETSQTEPEPIKKPLIKDKPGDEIESLINSPLQDHTPAPTAETGGTLEKVEIVATVSKRQEAEKLIEMRNKINLWVYDLKFNPVEKLAKFDALPNFEEKEKYYETVRDHFGKVWSAKNSEILQAFNKIKYGSKEIRDYIGLMPVIKSAEPSAWTLEDMRKIRAAMVSDSLLKE